MPMCVMATRDLCIVCNERPVQWRATRRCGPCELDTAPARPPVETCAGCGENEAHPGNGGYCTACYAPR